MSSCDGEMMQNSELLEFPMKRETEDYFLHSASLIDDDLQSYKIEVNKEEEIAKTDLGTDVKEECGKGKVNEEVNQIKEKIKNIICGNYEQQFSGILGNLDTHMLSHTGSKTFSKQVDLKAHNETHTRRSFECIECGKAFSQKGKLTEHHRIHTGVKPFNCDVCSKAFSRKSHLKEHYRTHNREKRYKCNVCGEAFSMKGDLTIHYSIHTGEKLFKCNTCGKAYSKQCNLSTHMRLHKGDIYKCHICGKDFTKKYSLSEHLRIHSGEKPFKCNGCDKAFSDRSSLTKHHRVHTGEKPYKCSICDKAFSDKSTLTKHNRIHTGEKPFKCSVCDKAFSLEGNLTTHYRIHTSGRRGNRTYKEKSETIPSSPSINEVQIAAIKGTVKRQGETI